MNREPKKITVVIPFWLCSLFSTLGSAVLSFALIAVITLFVKWVWNVF
jgi:hypothetical protein